MLIGNGAIDFSIGDEKSLDDSVELAYAGFLGLIYSGKYTAEDLKLADMIFASNTDKIINMANISNFSNDTYEEVASCYRTIGLQIIKNAEVVSKNMAKVRSSKEKALEKMKRFLKAG